ncbi:MAG: DoxX family protein [Gammaproteobacteria bacterium]|nr:MAG: DoxX family protein [Gammaproteobacteria bacterium]
MRLFVSLQELLEKFMALDFIAPLLIRIFLAPIFILAGYGKLSNMESTIWYFENTLGIPYADIMGPMAGGVEFFGGILMLIGLATRWIVVPLMFTMIVAAATAHWQHGWHALPETTLTVPWEWRMDLIDEAVERKEAVKSLAKKYGNYEWLTEAGYITILKNGIEFAATYFIMLLVLFFMGAGRYLSFDYYIHKRFMYH